MPKLLCLHPSCKAFKGVSNKSPTDFSEARNLGIVVGTAKMNLQKKVQEMRGRYQSKAPQLPEEVHLRWQELLGPARIGTQDDLEQVLAKLRVGIAGELEQQKIVIID